MPHQECFVCNQNHGDEVRHGICPVCCSRLTATPDSNFIDKGGEQFYIPYFSGRCDKCGWI